MLKTLGKKSPALLTVIPLITGILISYYSGINLQVLNDWFFITSLIFIGAFIIVMYNLFAKGELYYFSYVFLLLLFGIFSFQYRYYNTDPKSIASLLAKENTNSGIPLNVTLKAVVSESPEVTDERMRLLLDVVTVNDSAANGTVLASVYKNRFKEDVPAGLKYGDIVEVSGRVEQLPGERNPGEFDYGKYLKLHGVDAVFTSFGYEKITITGREEPNPIRSYIIYPVREYCIYKIDEQIGGSEGEYLKGLLLGERSNIPKQVKENFINAGVAHIIAVSGLNVAYVILIIWGILLFIPLKNTYKIFITIACLLFYMELTGNTPSIIRAVIMASIFLISQIAERRPNSYNIISFAALVILVMDPRQLFDAGFLLSFSAIVSLVIIYPIFDKWFRAIKWCQRLDDKKLLVKAFKAVTALFTGTLAAQIGTLPITAIMFKKVSIVSLAANLFAIPLSNITLAIGFIMVLVSPLSIWLASVFASVNSMLLYVQLWLIEVCASFDFAYVETYFVDVLMFVCYYIILVLLLTITKRNALFRIAMIALLVMNYWIFRDVSNLTDEAELSFLYTGSSSSTLITMPQGTTILINAGTSTEKYNSAGRTVIPQLKSKGADKVDLLILNSLDADEFRNLLYLVNNFRIGKVVLPVYYKPIMERKAFAGNFRDIQIEYITSSKVINRQGSFRLYIYYDSLARGPAMMSQFIYGDQSFIFNDATGEQQNIYNTAYIFNRDLVSQVFRISGAGSFHITPPELLLNIGSEYVLIGESPKGKTRIGSEAFSRALLESGFNVLNTSRSGAVIMRTNGDYTRIVDWR